MDKIILLVTGLLFLSLKERPSVEITGHSKIHTSKTIPKEINENLWVFIMAGQSNMAGRGLVEPEDTIPDKRIFSINKNGQIVSAKEPLHFYEPDLMGLDCGMSFARSLIEHLPGNISILLIPTAVGGSSISQWLGDSLHREVKLYSNFLEKLAKAKEHGVVKGILWHQGESDSNEKGIPLYKQRLSELVLKFRADVGNKELPVLMGELGAYSENKENWARINAAIHAFSSTDANSVVIPTGDLTDKGDHIHFNSEGQREMGRRFASAYLQKFSKH